MKTKQNSIVWLGLALACGTLTFAITTQAAKPIKPPPTPTGPVYQIVSLGSAGGANITVDAINAAGWVAGSVSPTPGQCFGIIVVPESAPGGLVYYRDTSPADGINDLMRVLPILPGVEQSGPYALNDSGWLAGYYLPPAPEWMIYRAMVWAQDQAIDLRLPTGDDTDAVGINNLGWVVAGPSSASYNAYYSTPCYVVVPEDRDGDGIPDTWSEDADGDGLNDLLKVAARPTGFNTRSGLWTNIFNAVAINDAGQVLLRLATGGAGFRLTPDFADADGDGNPWFADANADDFNDLMVKLIGLGGSATYATDINAAGQVVGISNDRAVRWDIAADGTQTATDLGLLSKTVRRMLAWAINDQGEIVGNAVFTSRGTAFLYKNGKLYDLAALLTNGAGWANLGASDINNQGVILGTGEFNGISQGFVAVPVTQP